MPNTNDSYYLHLIIEVMIKLRLSIRFNNLINSIKYVVAFNLL